MDSLLLAPGLHYQQAADELFRKGDASSIVNIVDERGGATVALKLNNAATANYIQRIAKPGETVTLDVCHAVAARGRYKLRRSNSGNHATAWRERSRPELGWISHLLYLSSPVLTLTAVTFTILFKDCESVSHLWSISTPNTARVDARVHNGPHDVPHPQHMGNQAAGVPRKVLT
jgi:hypothetical protein